MKVVVPMAGRGSRLAGYDKGRPKPLIDIAGRPMVAWALESLNGVRYSQIIFVALREHESRFGLTHILKRLLPDSEVQIILLDDVTEGQLCTVLAAGDFINVPEDVLIISSDTLVVSNIGQDIAARKDACRGLISVAEMPGERWSFARVDRRGQVVEVAEKRRISGLASTGIYYFTRGDEFVSVADDMIARGERTRGEFYVIPVYQKFIQMNWQVEVSMATEMWDMGTPEGLQTFEQQFASRKEIAL